MSFLITSEKKEGQVAMNRASQSLYNSNKQTSQLGFTCWLRNKLFTFLREKKTLVATKSPLMNLGSNGSFQHESTCAFFKWLSLLILTYPRPVRCGLRGRNSLEVLEESFSVGVPVSLKTVRTSWCPAGLKFPLAQKIYYLTTSHLQLSTALLSYSCCRLMVDGKSYLVQIAS